MIGSTFPEKLVFDGGRFRTTRVNEVVEVICTLDKSFSENKNGEADVNFDFSTLVPETGFEPARRFQRYHLKVVRLPVSPPGRVLLF